VRHRPVGWLFSVLSSTDNRSASDTSADKLLAEKIQRQIS
jgi:hypothetical protein